MHSILFYGSTKLFLKGGVVKKITHYMADVSARRRSKKEFIRHAFFLIISSINNRSRRKTKDIFQLLNRKLQDLKKATKGLRFLDGSIGSNEIELMFQENFSQEYSGLLAWRKEKGTKK